MIHCVPATAQHAHTGACCCSYMLFTHVLVANLFLGHDDSNSLSIKLRSACSPDHLQAGAAVILLVAGCVCSVAAPPAGALQDYQVCWQVYSHGQSRCCAQHLYGSTFMSSPKVCVQATWRQSRPYAHAQTLRTGSLLPSNPPPLPPPSLWSPRCTFNDAFSQKPAKTDHELLLDCAFRAVLYSIMH